MYSALCLWTKNSSKTLILNPALAAKSLDVLQVPEMCPDLRRKGGGTAINEQSAGASAFRLQERHLDNLFEAFAPAEMDQRAPFDDVAVICVILGLHPDCRESVARPGGLGFPWRLQFSPSNDQIIDDFQNGCVPGITGLIG